MFFKYIKDKHPRMGFIVSKKYGNAVKRNKFKRRCRELFNNNMSQNNQYTIIVRPVKKNLNYQEIREAFSGLFQKI